MQRTRILAAAAHALVAGAIVLTAAGFAGAAEYDVPAGFATVQAAVAAASGSGDVDNFINISMPVVSTGAEIMVGGLFNETRKLTIRPDPDAGLTRATIASTNPSVALFRFEGAGYVTLQDLDLVRNITNNYHLIVMEYPGVGNDHITVERCRIGSIWTTPGSAGWQILRIAQPTEIVVRNCILFSYFPGTFDIGVFVFDFNDPANSIYLYNNDVADHEVFGIAINNDFPGTRVVLRNNVVANHMSLPPEPSAYRSNVVVGVTVLTSHNVAFASGGVTVESQIGAVSLLAGGGASVMVMPKPDVNLSFHQTQWDLDPFWDPNPSFFRLIEDGKLHEEPGDRGVALPGGAPDVSDLAVIDDIERDTRTSGDPLHMDRGADQIERGTSAETGIGFGHDAAPDLVLQTAPVRNPSDHVAVAYRAAEPGRLVFEVFDVAGRRLHRADRLVAADASGSFEWNGARDVRGIVAYRVELVPLAGPVRRDSGKVVLIR